MKISPANTPDNAIGSHVNMTVGERVADPFFSFQRTAPQPFFTPAKSSDSGIRRQTGSPIIQRQVADLPEDRDWGHRTGGECIHQFTESMPFARVRTDCPAESGVHLADALLQLRGRIEGNSACMNFFREHYGEDPISLLTRRMRVTFTVDPALTTSGHTDCQRPSHGCEAARPALVSIQPALCSSPHLYRVLLHELTHVSDCYGGHGESFAEVTPDQAADVCIGTVLQQLELRDRAAAASTAAEDWNFSPTDMISLKGRGLTLRFEGDSQWFPSAMQENLRNTILYLLVPRTDQPRTAGVNPTDFFHGHLVVPRGHEPQSLIDQRNSWYTAISDARERALGPGSHAPVTAGNLANYQAEMPGLTRISTPLITAAIAQPGAAVIYHTFEFPQAGSAGARIQAGSPIRNFRTPLSNNSPEPYTEPAIDNASSYMDNPSAPYVHIYQFSFLIDRTGVVHVRPDFARELSDVVGAPVAEMGGRP